jgi:hypothetical protein
MSRSFPNIRHPDFSSVATAPAAEHLRLLNEGDDPEKLWATWVIASRIGKDFLPALRKMASELTGDALRQQLLVILAGFGERAHLAAIATSDEPDVVRATAAALYVRTAEWPGDPELVAVATAWSREGPADVRAALLEEQRAGRLRLAASALEDVAERDRVREDRRIAQAFFLDDGEDLAFLGALYLAPERFSLSAIREGLRIIAERRLDRSPHR